MEIDEKKLKDAKALADSMMPLPPADVERLASVMEFKTAAKGEQLIRQGQVADCMLFITKGLARQFYYKGDHDITEHFTSEGELLYCIESLFTLKPTDLMAEALEPLEYYKVHYHQLKKFIPQSPNIAKWLVKWFETDAIVSQHKADAMRFETAKERYERFQKEYPEAAKRAPIQHIASYLIITRESLSRVRAGKL